MHRVAHARRARAINNVSHSFSGRRSALLMWKHCSLLPPHHFRPWLLENRRARWNCIHDVPCTQRCTVGGMHENQKRSKRWWPAFYHDTHLQWLAKNELSSCEFFQRWKFLRVRDHPHLSTSLFGLMLIHESRRTQNVCLINTHPKRTLHLKSHEMYIMTTLFVSMICPLQIISSRMKCAFSMLNMISSSHWNKTRVSNNYGAVLMSVCTYHILKVFI